MGSEEKTSWAMGFERKIRKIRMIWESIAKNLILTINNINYTITIYDKHTCFKFLYNLKCQFKHMYICIYNNLKLVNSYSTLINIPLIENIFTIYHLHMYVYRFNKSKTLYYITQRFAYLISNIHTAHRKYKTTMYNPNQTKLNLIKVTL